MATLKDLIVSGPARVLDTVFANYFVKINGTSSQFLKADGSVDSNSYALSSSIPTVNNATLTVKGDGTYTSVGTSNAGDTFTANASSNKTITVNHATRTESTTTSTAAPDLTSSTTANRQITIVTPTFNAAGHETGKDTKTVTFAQITAASLGLTDIMHFKGAVSSLPTATTSDSYSNGDVIIVTGTNKEYVRSGKTSSAAGSWVELGDEGSYVLKTQSVANFGTAPITVTGTVNSFTVSHQGPGTSGADITAQSNVGNNTTTSLSHGGTFTVPYFSYNAKGHITGSGTKTLTLPGSGNTDTKVTQTVTTSSNTSYRPLIIGASYSDATTFSPATTTDTVYATHLAKYKPDTGVLAIVGLNKMASNGTVSAGSDTTVWNTNGGTTTLNYMPSQSALGSETKPLYLSAANTFTECSQYAGGTAVTLNGTSKASITASFYAPTAAGTSGQFLKSSGSGAPSWSALPAASTTAAGIIQIGTGAGNAAAGNHDHSGVYQPAGTYLTTFNAADNYAFKTVAPGTASTAVTAPTANTTSQTAESNTDTLTVTPSNKWISVGGSTTASTDILYIGHKIAGTNGSYGTSTDSTPAHGGNFYVPYITVDEAGHITAASSKKITLPSDSNTDTLVKQTADATGTEYPMLMSAQASPTSGTAYEAKYSASLKANGNGDIVFTKSSTKCRVQYDSSAACLNFLFE